MERTFCGNTNDVKAPEAVNFKLYERKRTTGIKHFWLFCISCGEFYKNLQYRKPTGTQIVRYMTKAKTEGKAFERSLKKLLSKHGSPRWTRSPFTSLEFDKFEGNIIILPESDLCSVSNILSYFKVPLQRQSTENQENLIQLCPLLQQRKQVTAAYHSSR